MKQWHWFLERLALYLPVLLMGLLALATYWLVRSTPTTGAASTTTAVLHQPDYFMRQFSVKTFDAQGWLKSEINGEQAQHYPDTDTLEINQVLLRSFDQNRNPTIATANHGLSNSDGSEFTLTQNVNVLRQASPNAAGQMQPDLRFSGEHLQILVNNEQMRSNKPVLLKRNQDQFSAEHMTFDNRLQTVQLDGHVKGVLIPNTKHQE